MTNRSFMEGVSRALPDPDEFKYNHLVLADDIDVSEYAEQTIKLQVAFPYKNDYIDTIMNGQISSTGKTISLNLDDTDFFKDGQWRLDTKQILQNESETRSSFVIELYSPYSWASSYKNANRFREDIYEEIGRQYRDRSDLRQMTHLHYDMSIYEYMKEVVAEKDSEKLVSATI